ncbi:trimeric LpxA-like protein [Polychaeton citri CBS 116435]|uniref:Dynactin subunit 5 n=1 Tax=Polychaeton citri CBS 116435 TaxID=1314669 RepID=A0A9P4URE3_9PEZI|nr:trimeric LpxA-like protein [Polychaeton citri CBS 116435]
MSRPSVAARRVAKSEYVETESGNKISRRSHIEGKANIVLGGKTVIMAGVHMRADLHRKSEEEGKERSPTTAITIGRATVIATNCTIRPPMRVRSGQMTFYPLRVGDNVFIGPGTHVSAISISSHVHIGADCVLSPFCVVKEFCKIMPGTVVPPHMVIPPGSIVEGRPARIIGEVGEGWGQGGGGEGEEWVEGGDLRALVRSIK